MTPTVAAVIVARDESVMIDGCLARLHFADEIIVVVDDRTTDDTLERALAAGVRTSTHRFTTFANMKNHAVEQARSDWVLIVDADERVTSALAREVLSSLDKDVAAFRVPIANYFYGRRIRWGGWRERPIRLFRVGAAAYSGAIHERLVFDDDGVIVGDLKEPLLHFSHRSVIDNLRKTAAYADVQAHEMLSEGHPRVTSRTLLKAAASEVFRRLVVGQGFRDGVPGMIESTYQPFSLLCVYARLWELQQSPPIEEQYQELDRLLQ